MNHLQSKRSLRNQYYLMRHGQSKANVAGLIISHPAHGILDEYTLSELGREQAKASAMQSLLPRHTIIYCSDFSRARETAEIVHRELRAASPIVTALLRERNFGDFEKTSSENYQRVWELDAQDPQHTSNNVEAASSVMERATRLILELEDTHDNEHILLVSHGDTLQILQTAFQKIDPSKHRSLTHLEVAEIRNMKLL